MTAVAALHRKVRIAAAFSPPTKSVIYAALGLPSGGTPSISLIPPRFFSHAPRPAKRRILSGIAEFERELIRARR